MVEIFDNIKKRYQFIAPCTELSAYIEYFWESSFAGNPDKSFNIKLFPSLTPTFSINLGAPYKLITGKDRHEEIITGDILSLRSTITEYRYVSGSHKFGVKFLPGGLFAVLGINQTVFTSNTFSLQKLLPPTLISTIKTQHSFNERVSVLQDYLFVQYQKRNKKDYNFLFTQKVIELYGFGNMEFKNNEIASQLFTTTKTINRYFNKVIGDNSKNYLFLIRARTALTAYVNNKQAFSPLNFGYYDMSHFYKDVVKFTGNKLIDHPS
ncbi:DUF6597 domain-containing transcriptional factor [Chitinophagaceae bacterium LWZ2-11]